MICYNYRKIAVADFLKQAKIYNGQYAKLFKLFENQTGIGNFSFKNIGKIYDIHRELIHNMTEKQPDWVFKTWPEYGNRSTMEIVKELYRIQVITDSYVLHVCRVGFPLR
ncbi:hypothetical protein OESDEN_05030 [Oesophagostomum dentatum]|uniref:Uncharacterized protein n=1 Tax=Oesophagostomum dentatum TaxID=61180 RepID=A0A0B1TFZ2_OESDE|nr:hypothetical protein OESDEN_05030 [Oesophagostomum dentatum]